MSEKPPQPANDNIDPNPMGGIFPTPEILGVPPNTLEERLDKPSDPTKPKENNGDAQ